MFIHYIASPTISRKPMAEGVQLSCIPPVSSLSSFSFKGLAWMYAFKEIHSKSNPSTDMIEKK
jgi:hypothetical protein